ncbi:MAG: oligosaccharide flippase family protein [Phycisphaerae bacterium]|nr:oligosaccharide flippase family protein [Phycisphaerae bacterium]
MNHGATGQQGDLLTRRSEASASRRSPPRSLIANAFWNTLATAFSIVALFLLTPFIISRIGIDEYGIYLAIISIGGLAGVLGLGLGEASIRFVAYYDGRHDDDAIGRVVQASLLVHACTATLSAAALILGARLILSLLELSEADAALAANLVVWTAQAFWLRSISATFRAIPRALQRYDVSGYVAIAETLFRVVGIATLLYHGYGLTALAVWNVAVAAFGMVLDLLAARRLLPSLRFLGIPPWSAFREVLSYGIWAFLSQAMGMIWQHADRLLLAGFVGVGAVAYFAVPQDLVLRGLHVVASGGAVLMPRFSAMADRDQHRSLYVSTTLALLCLTTVVFVPVTVLLPDFLRLWISAEFADKSGFVGQLIAASCILRGAFLPYESLFRGIGKPQYYLALTVLTSGTLLGTSAILIPVYGLTGAGYSFCLSPAWGLVAIALTWRCVLRQRGLGGPARFVGVPLCLGVLCLCLSLWLRMQWPLPLGTVQLIALAVTMAGMTGLTMFGYERAMTGQEGFSGRMSARLRSLLVRRRETA